MVMNVCRFEEFDAGLEQMQFSPSFSYSRLLTIARIIIVDRSRD